MKGFAIREKLANETENLHKFHFALKTRALANGAISARTGADVRPICVGLYVAIRPLSSVSCASMPTQPPSQNHKTDAAAASGSHRLRVCPDLYSQNTYRNAISSRGVREQCSASTRGDYEIVFAYQSMADYRIDVGRASDSCWQGTNRRQECSRLC